MLNKTIFSNNLLFLRKTRNVKQKDLAVKLSISVKTLQRWEDKESESWPSAPELFALEQIFNVTAEKICKQDLSTGKDRNLQQKIDKIEARIESDPLFFAFCHLAYSKHSKEIEAWLNLMEIQYLTQE